MKNIHVLPTDKPSRLHFWTDENGTKLELCELEYSHTRNTQHIYITSSEEIKEGDNVILKSGRLTKAELREGILGFQTIDGIAFLYFQEGDKKIILTTDQDLINDGVQAIPNDFLEWYVENPRCEEVEVVKEMYMPQSNGKISDGKITHELSLNESLNTLPFYRMIIPKQQADTPNPAEQLISGLRVLSQTFTHNELESILEQLYYVKSQAKLEFYFDQIKLNATAADLESAFQYGYFDTLTAMGKN
jgi:hypothetical protein